MSSRDTIPDESSSVSRTSPRCTRPVSFAQRSLWLIHQLEPSSTEYHVSRAFRIRGRLDVDLLRRAVALIADRHEVLRTIFEFDDDVGEPVQVVAGDAPAIECIDLPAIPDGESRLLAEMTSRLDEPFDLRNGPLWRISVWRLAADECVLLIVLHHIVCDGSSIRILLRELSRIYSEMAAGARPSLQPLRLQYGEWISAQRDRASDRRLRDDLLFWRQQLEGAPSVLPLPTDRPRGETAGHRGRRIPIVFPPQLCGRLRDVCRQERVTSFMVLVTAFQVLLARYARLADVVVGVPVLGRTSLDAEPIIGMFVNTLAVRADMRSAPSFRSLMMQVRARLLDAYARQEVPLEDIAGHVAIERRPGVHPLFQVLFTMHNLPNETLELAGCDVSAINLDVLGDGSLRCRTTAFDLRMDLAESETGVVGCLAYRVDLFDASTIQRWIDDYMTLLSNVFADVTRSVMHIPLAAADERAALPGGVVSHRV